jgi:hypothetical protein
MKRIKHAGLNGLLAAAAITLAGCVPPGANTSAATAALEHCSDFHYPQPAGFELPLKAAMYPAVMYPAVYDQFGPKEWSTGAGGYRVECSCMQNMNFADSSKEFLRAIVNKSLGDSLLFQMDGGDVLSVVGNEAQYEFQGTSQKPEYHGNVYLGRMIGAGSCLFVEYSVTTPNSSSEELNSERNWLRSVNFRRQSKPSWDSALSLSVSDRLKELDELRDQHRISDDEYRLQRARILNGI